MFWGFARIFAVFGFAVYLGSPFMDWLFGNGWQVEVNAYVRGTIASFGMLAFEIRRFRRSQPGSALRRR